MPKSLCRVLHAYRYRPTARSEPGERRKRVWKIFNLSAGFCCRFAVFLHAIESHENRELGQSGEADTLFPDFAPRAGRASLWREMTEAEKRLWRRLRLRQTHGCRFRRRAPIGSFIVDCVCRDARLIVEIDGGQHDPSSEPEVQRARFFENEGYSVLRFWNNDALDNRNGVQMAIARHLRQVLPRPCPPPSRDRSRGRNEDSQALLATAPAHPVGS